MAEKRTLYLTDYCLSPYDSIARGAILCEGDKIIAMGGSSAFSQDPDMKIVDMSGTYALPGFIDTHTHGAGGFDSSTGFKSGHKIEKMCATLASHGITSFIPTIVSGPVNDMLSAISMLVKELKSRTNGAEACGLNIEGPFISHKKSGSQKKSDIMKIDLGLAKELIQAAKGNMKIMTFAPELKKSIKLIELLKENGIEPSMGHSVAEEDSVIRAVNAGSHRCTHLYNGMPALHQRHSSLTSVALTDDRITVELILDGYHLNPRMVDLACRTKPKDKLVGMSDSVEGAGLKDGKYHLGSSVVNVKNGIVRNDDGVLAGTTLTLEEGWHHLITYSHLSQTEAAACFSANPAKSISLDDRGELLPGKRADISFFNTETNQVMLTLVNGKVAYDPNEMVLRTMKRVI